MGDYKPPFTISDTILSYVSSVSEKIGRITERPELCVFIDPVQMVLLIEGYMRKSRLYRHNLFLVVLLCYAVIML